MQTNETFERWYRDNFTQHSISYQARCEQAWQASREHLLSLLDSPEIKDILKNALYVKHPLQTEDERVQRTINAIKEMIENDQR